MTLDSFIGRFGPDALASTPDRSESHRWHSVCVCGHLRKYHSESIDGEYQLTPERTQQIRGETVTIVTNFTGCVGALKTTGFEEVTTVSVDRAANRMVEQINPTCGCEQFTEVAKVDRPNRYFNQRCPTDREDPTRHPMVIGVRALHTHLTRRKAGVDNPDWVRAEFERRFTWTDARVCGIARCTSTDDVWPQYVGDRSELRCAAHA